MHGGLFVALYDEQTLKLYLSKGVYGFLMKPVFTDAPSCRSKHFSILADYACSREGADIFFFLKRKIVYGGKIYGNKDAGSFYINGLNSPLGRKTNANLFWDESSRYKKTEQEGVFKVNGANKAQPFMFQFRQNENTGKYIVSDDLYFELGKYPYPLPSNSMQGMGFCTLTPGEVSTILKLIDKSKNRIDFNQYLSEINKQGEEQLFESNLVDINDNFINEAQLEFTLLASLKPLCDFLSGNYILCRQVPISPFKPMDMDRADICLYNVTDLIKDGTVPNVIIELKRGRANFHAYDQVTRYLRWLERITTQDEFDKIQVFLIANSFVPIKRNKVDTTYEEKIKILSIDTFNFENLV